MKYHTKGLLCPDPQAPVPSHPQRSSRSPLREEIHCKDESHAISPILRADAGFQEDSVRLLIFQSPGRKAVDRKSPHSPAVHSVTAFLTPVRYSFLFFFHLQANTPAESLASSFLFLRHLRFCIDKKFFCGIAPILSSPSNNRFSSFRYKKRVVLPGQRPVRCSVFLLHFLSSQSLRSLPHD